VTYIAATATIPVGQVTLARFVVQAALMLPVALLMRVPLRMGRRMAWLTLWRAVFRCWLHLLFCRRRSP
ncbi:MAG: hypothetical protein U5N10_07425, partial [Gemmobacter sp.]|nr:hypothetical protein [Gemmobacter sp.]